MFRKDIENIYTNTIMKYINEGYRINCNTMSGSQGEIAKVDLTNDKEIIRIYLFSNMHYEERYLTESISLIVGRNTDRITGQMHYDIIWNNHLEIISEQHFYKIGKNNNYYGTKEEAINATKKSYVRVKNRININNNNVFVFPDKAKEIVLPFMRKQYKCKSIKINEIEKVEKIISEGKTFYYVTARGKNYKLR